MVHFNLKSVDSLIDSTQFRDTTSMEIIIMARMIVNCFIMHVALPEMLVGRFRQHSSVTAIGLMEKEIRFIGTPSYVLSHSQQTRTFHVIILHKLPKHN